MFIQYYNHVALAPRDRHRNRRRMGRRFRHRQRDRRVGAARREARPRRLHRPVGLSRLCAIDRALRQGHRSRRRLYAAPALQIGRRDTLVPPRRTDVRIAASPRCAAAIRPGVTERELGAAIEASYLPYGGTNVIHFIGATSMADARLPRAAAIPVDAADRERRCRSSPRSAPRFGTIPARSCAASPSMPSRHRFIAICTQAADAAFDAVAARAARRRDAGRCRRRVRRDRGGRLHHRRRHHRTAMAAAICRRSSARKAGPPASCPTSPSRPA